MEDQDRILSRIDAALSFLQSHFPNTPEWVMVLGSGLGSIAEELEEPHIIPYQEIPGFPVSTVVGHAGRLLVGKWAGKQVLIMQGRFHYYEGYSMQEITIPMRVFGLWGIRNLLVSNAAGGLNPAHSIGEVMWISDHINAMGNHPLIGPHRPEWGARFPDMSSIYRSDWRQKALEISEKYGQKTSQGVFMAVSGPTYETPAEYRAFRNLGADAVGMSTVPEVIVAHQMGLSILGFSVISDLGVEGKVVEVSHQKVVEEVRKVAERMGMVLKDLLPMLG